MPCVTAVLNDNTAIHQAMDRDFYIWLEVKENEAAGRNRDTAGLPAEYYRRAETAGADEGSAFENNNSEIYHMLGGGSFFLIILVRIWQLW